jgi:hypothetical protein
MNIQQLQRQNEKLKAELECKDDLVNLEREQKQLMQENKKLGRELKFGQEIGLAKDMGKTSWKILKVIGSNIMKFCRHIEKVERQNKVFESRLERIKRSKIRPKKK